jgi:hypothetical protein
VTKEIEDTEKMIISQDIIWNFTAVFVRLGTMDESAAIEADNILYSYWEC